MMYQNQDQMVILLQEILKKLLKKDKAILMKKLSKIWILVSQKEEKEI